MPAIITQDDAIRIATDDIGGFLGTWVHADPVDGGWHVHAASKSANPPVLYVLDGAGRILFKAQNSDDVTLAGDVVDSELTISEGLKIRVEPGAPSGPAKLWGSLKSRSGVLTLTLHRP